MDGYLPWGAWSDREASPGEVAQRWARLAAIGLAFYVKVKLTEGEVEALAKLLARFIVETRKKTGVDLIQVE